MALVEMHMIKIVGGGATIAQTMQAPDRDASALSSLRAVRVPSMVRVGPDMACAWATGSFFKME